MTVRYACRTLWTLAAICCAVSAGAVDRQVPASADEIRFSFAPIVKRVAPSVVNVYASRVIAESASPFFADPFFQRFFGGGNGVDSPRKRVQQSLGSGVIIDPSGIIVTNNHVIANADQIRVALSDRREFDCDVVLKDERTDLAVLKLRDAKGTFPTLDLADSDGLQVGDLVLAIGDPFGVGQTVTSGIVSALARTQVGVSDYQFFIQTDAAINPGNSGGALIDMSGRLVGINTSIFSHSGDSSGIGFAIPSNMVRVIAQSAKTGGQVRLPWVGASFQGVTPDIAAGLGVSEVRGALVVEVDSGQSGGEGGPEERRPRRLDRRHRGRRSVRTALSDRHQGHRRRGQARHPPRRQAVRRHASARGRAGNRSAGRDRDCRGVAPDRGEGGQSLPGGCRGVGL